MHTGVYHSLAMIMGCEAHLLLEVLCNSEGAALHRVGHQQDVPPTTGITCIVRHRSAITLIVGKLQEGLTEAYFCGNLGVVLWEGVCCREYVYASSSVLTKIQVAAKSLPAAEQWRCVRACVAGRQARTAVAEALKCQERLGIPVLLKQTAKAHHFRQESRINVLRPRLGEVPVVQFTRVSDEPWAAGSNRSMPRAACLEPQA